jgi:WD40-like Beta Propeller Repeat
LSQSDNLQQKLREGIAAAQQGDKTAARRLLQQVLSVDRNNELAWMWMASVVETADEKRSCLERALKINPNNQRAREALRRLGVDVDAPTTDARATPPRGDSLASRVSGGNRNLYFIAAAVIALLVLGVVFASLFPANPAPQANTQQTANAVFSAAISTFTPAPTIDPASYTATPFLGVIVTLAPDSVILPATFTPTPTQLPTETPVPSATPFPLSGFPMRYTAFIGGASVPALAGINADGVGASPVAGGERVSEASISPDGNQVVFVRGGSASAESTPSADAPSSGGSPQLYIAPAQDLAAAQQITNLSGSLLSSPSWSPDGSQIVFSSNQDGDSEIFVVASNGGEARQLTSNEASDTTPVFSPDGARLVYASDTGSPSFQELYSLNLASNEVTRLTNAAGSSFAPAFSPDGTRIAFVSTRTGDSDIYVMDANGQRPFLVTIDDGDADDRVPMWSPDGRWIGFVSNRAGNGYQIFVINPAGDTLLPVTSIDGNVESFSFIPVSVP